MLRYSYRKELAPLEASATLYAKWADETKEKKCCPVCERTFGRDNEGTVGRGYGSIQDGWEAQ